MSQLEQMLGTVGGQRGGRTVLEDTVPFMVKKPMGLEEVVFAHNYIIVDGCLQFITMKSKDVDVPNEKNELVKRTAIYQTFPKTFNRQTWETVEPVFIPPADAAQIAN